MTPTPAPADTTDAATPVQKKSRKSRAFLPPALLGRESAAAYLTISESSLDRLSAAGEVPAPVRLGGRIAWGRAELASWVRHGCPARPAWQRLWVGLRDRSARRK